MKLIIGLMFSVAIVGCVTPPKTYSGPKPDLSLSGKAADNEVRKFTLVESAWSCASPCFENEVPRQEYSWQSMLPVVESVSPDAVRKYKQAAVWSKVQVYSLGVGVAGLVLGLVSRGDQRDMFFTASLVGSTTSILTPLIYAAFFRPEIQKTYNRDLKNKFTPVLGMNWSY